MNAERRTEAQLYNLPIEAIHVSTTNPRRHVDEVALEELAASIAQVGVQMPLMVRFRLDGNGVALDDEYELVAGERRLLSASKAGLIEVPCLVREMTDAEAREAQITENLQRADVHPVEEAEAYRLLIADSAAHGLSTARTVGDIARKFGKAEAYVARRLKLLDLELAAKLMYAKGHLTLGHAEMLARLTPKDQERALRFMLNSDPKFDKRELTEVIRGELERRGSYDGGNVLYVSGPPRKASDMLQGRRLVECTEAQLKTWVGQNVLLQLANVPWRLEDATLVSVAGGCDTCPKRSGSNAALFSDLTAEEDVCLDPVCFAAKQKAMMARQKEGAKATGGHLVKISSKPSFDKMEEPAIDRRPLKEAGGVVVGETVTVTKKTVRAGQWVSAQDVSCADAIEALMVDGPDQGRMLKVCANQACKVHKHTVDKPRDSSGGGPVGESWEARSKREAEERKVRLVKQAEYERAELPVYLAVFAGILLTSKIDATEELRWQLIQYREESADSVQAATMLGVAFAGDPDTWIRRNNAEEALDQYIQKASYEQLLQVAFCFREHDALDMGEFDGENNRLQLWKLAKKHGVNPDKLVKAMAAGLPAQPKPAPAKKVAAKKQVAKPVAKKKAGKTISPEQRKKIAANMKKRWAAARKKAVTK